MTDQKNKQQVPNKETYSRMNFLYQASMLMAGKNNTLSAYFGQQCKSIGRKAQLKITPDLKRDLCKCCALAQYPGVTSNLNITQQKKRRHKRKVIANKSDNIDDCADVIMTCCKCGFKRKLMVNSDYKFWLENPASIAEEIRYDVNKDIEKTKVETKETT